MTKMVENVGKAYGALAQFGKYMNQSSLDKNLMELIHFRVSQINKCAYCLDMHSKELRAHGEDEQRLYLVAAWRESPVYSKRERAALAFAEALTGVNNNSHLEDVLNEVRKEFTEDEMIDLTVGIIAINSYNRLNVALGAPVGTYKVGQFN